MSEWISIKDSEPIDPGEYFVLINGRAGVMDWGYVHLSLQVGFIKVYNGWNNDKHNAPVTHWMKIPKIKNHE